jgi:hypothetical protein
MLAPFDRVVQADLRDNPLPLSAALTALQTLPRLASLRLDGITRAALCTALPRLEYVNGVAAQRAEAADAATEVVADEERSVEAVLERVWRVTGSYRSITATSDRTEKTWFCAFALSVSTLLFFSVAYM